MISLRNSIPALICALALGACGAAENATVPASSVQAGAVQPTSASYKIYVANIGDGTITTFEPDGTPTSPTIAIVNYLYAIAIAPMRQDLRCYLRSARRSKLRRHRIVVQARRHANDADDYQRRHDL